VDLRFGRNASGQILIFHLRTKSYSHKFTQQSWFLH
jgi:hypothetical protein